MPVYATADITFSRHGHILKADWETDGTDDLFVVIGAASKAAINDPSDTNDQRLRQLATDLLAIPGVAPDVDNGRAAFSIRREEILLNTVPGTDLDAVEKNLLGILERYFGSEETMLASRTYRLSVVDTRPQG